MHLLFSSAGAVSEAELGNDVTYTPTKTATGTVATHLAAHLTTTLGCFYLGGSLLLVVAPPGDSQGPSQPG